MHAFSLETVNGNLIYAKAVSIIFLQLSSYVRSIFSFYKWDTKGLMNSCDMHFQDDPHTNAGRGSNLTEDGHVECDASIMDGDSGVFGAVGAVPGMLIPILYFFKKIAVHVLAFQNVCFHL